ncbi:MAG TPA: ATP-binding protein [Actinomycetes bacterium]|nr:ATP-binding protein [Actinomycetes bacterium]
MVTSLVRELDRRQGAPADARNSVRDLFRGLADTDSDRVDSLAADVELVVSELVTNAVVHGTGPITLRVRVIDGFISVGVQDRGLGVPQLHGADPSREGGRGMAVVAGLVSDWGVRVDGDTGKEVWAILAVQVPPNGEPSASRGT